MSANVKFEQQKWQQSLEEFGQCQYVRQLNSIFSQCCAYLQRSQALSVFVTQPTEIPLRLKLTAFS